MDTSLLSLMLGPCRPSCLIHMCIVSNSYVYGHISTHTSSSMVTYVYIQYSSLHIHGGLMSVAHTATHEPTCSHPCCYAALCPTMATPYGCSLIGDMAVPVTPCIMATPCAIFVQAHRCRCRLPHIAVQTALLLMHGTYSHAQRSL